MAASKIQIKKICEFCGKEFIAYKTSTRFCSKTCNSRSYKLERRKKQVCEIERIVHEEQENKPIEKCQHKDFLSPREAAFVVGISTRSIYNLIYKGSLKAAQLSSRMTLIKRIDIELMLDCNPYQKRHKNRHAPITEFYTTAEVEQKFNVGSSWVFKVAKEQNILKVFHRGKTLWSKKHFDAYFSKKAPEQSISEWYSVEDIMVKYQMTTTAVYSFVSTFQIPKQKIKGRVYYSKEHVDSVKNKTFEESPQYYTIPEAMAKYNMTRDQLYHYVKWHNIPKIKEGKYTKISSKELDMLLAPPQI